MRSISAAELLNVWEQALNQPLHMRGLALLAALDEGSPDTLARMPVGQVDARLLTLRDAVFGPEITGVSECPACAGRVELTFRASDVRVPQPAVGSDESELRIGDYMVRFRLARSSDLAYLTEATDLTQARRLLFERCVVQARLQDGPVEAGDLPMDVVGAVSEEMARQDPQADVRIELRCPECGRDWNAYFDVISFFWTEMHAWAQRILGEVHTLASIYHWSEVDILSMTAWRRQAYLTLAGG